MSFKDFVLKLTGYSSPNELMGVVKRLVNKNEEGKYGNDVKLVNSRYLNNLSLQQFGDNVVTVQRYVKAHGKKNFICRSFFSC